MPFNIFRNELKLAQPQPLPKIVNSTTLTTVSLELSSTTTYPASQKRKRDGYEESSESLYNAPEEDESLEDPEPEPSLTSSPFDTNDEFEGPTFQEWCAYQRAKE
ncbi:hypothetical protein QBC45DRAFT_442855 [Copromyces sp. CBS 386.78]|nr:hypothetical protein QBC45DRAFT_442855 [Copromyces sp. CBS 386.78]